MQCPMYFLTNDGRGINSTIIHADREIIFIREAFSNSFMISHELLRSEGQISFADVLVGCIL